MRPIKVIQAGPIRTGTTLLANLIHGFLAPEEKVHWHTDIKIHDFLITKTHDTNVDGVSSRYSAYDLYFVMSERNDGKIKELINDKYRTYKNVLIINYDSILVTDNLTLDDAVEDVYNKLYNFFPSEIIPKKHRISIKNDMLNRIINMNRIVEEIKDKPFDYCDPFYQIHGSHRNRS